MWGILLFVLACLTLEVRSQADDRDPAFWQDVADDELDAALEIKINDGLAKNVILFIGDGMSIPTLTAGRIYKGQLDGNRGEEGKLSFENFPNLGLSKTYNVDRQVPDSAGTSSAYLCGVKANFMTVGVSALVGYNDCASQLDNENLESAAAWAIKSGRSAGVVTTASITDGSPAGSYAHAANRRWECDAAQDADSIDCKDIARQLVEDFPGNGLTSIMGGGKLALRGDPDLPALDKGCNRQDGKDLIQDWLDSKAGTNSAFVETTGELRGLDMDKVDSVMGIFADSHTPYEYERDDTLEGTPHIAEMVIASLDILSKNPKGFFLFVEAAKIDKAHHDGTAKVALQELLALDEAVQVALDNTDPKETLIIVTADHAHGMAMVGFPVRGNPILGLAMKSSVDGLPYTTLMYSTGPGFNYTVKDGEAARHDISDVDTDREDYHQLATVPTSKTYHGGEDVAIYATGPMSHLFHSLHEQNYVAHAMAYAACMGPQEDNCGMRRNTKQNKKN